MKFLFLSIITVLSLSSCEVYEKYFVMASNRYGEAKITVKVKSNHYLPTKNILASKSDIGCNANTNTLKDNNFNTPVLITADTNKAQYSFILEPCLTVWLHPTRIGLPAIEYLIINDKDTIPIGDKSIINKNYRFKKQMQQKFLLTIK